MKFIKGLIFLAFLTASNLYAQNEPLVIGTTNFDPPFVMRAADNELFGFDIEMMNELCALMHRKCTYKSMRFEELLRAVADKKVDAAVNSITITPERANLVSFSLPYLLSYSRFLTLRTNTQNQAFSVIQLNNKSFGVTKETIFANQISEMGIKNPKIVEYDTSDKLLEGLQANQVDYVLLDNATSIYWVANSAGTFVTAGPPFLFGYGCGIAVNQRNNTLLQQINKALLTYQSNAAYKENYKKYIGYDL